jgi:hypothetical protein
MQRIRLTVNRKNAQVLCTLGSESSFPTFFSAQLFRFGFVGGFARRLPRMTGEPPRPKAAALRIARRTSRPRTNPCAKVGVGGGCG